MIQLPEPFAIDNDGITPIIITAKPVMDSVLKKSQSQTFRLNLHRYFIDAAFYNEVDTSALSFYVDLRNYFNEPWYRISDLWDDFSAVLVSNNISAILEYNFKEENKSIIRFKNEDEAMKAKLLLRCSYQNHLTQ